jgi:hypothetical protein
MHSWKVLYIQATKEHQVHAQLSDHADVFLCTDVPTDTHHACQLLHLSLGLLQRRNLLLRRCGSLPPAPLLLTCPQSIQLSCECSQFLVPVLQLLQYVAQDLAMLLMVAAG